MFQQAADTKLRAIRELSLTTDPKSTQPHTPTVAPNACVELWLRGRGFGELRYRKDCKSVIVGSNPTAAFIVSLFCWRTYKTSSTPSTRLNCHLLWICYETLRLMGLADGLARLTMERLVCT